MSLLGEEAYESGDGIIATRIGKLGDEVEANMRPRTGRDGVGLEEARRKLRGWLGTLAGGTGTHVRLYSTRHVGPPIKATGGVESAVQARVTTVSSIMHLMQDLKAKGWDVANIMLGMQRRSAA